MQKMELEPTVALLYLYEKIRIYCRWIQHMREAQAVTYMYFGSVCVCVRESVPLPVSMPVRALLECLCKFK